MTRGPIFEGRVLPIIVHHGTTERFIDWHTQQDGSYKLPALSYTIDATPGDVRGWPKNYNEARMGQRATIVINTISAYEGIIQLFTGDHLRFSHLPSGSFRVLRESQQSFSSGYDTAINNLEKKLGA